jgi:hypothetical protein
MFYNDHEKLYAERNLMRQGFDIYHVRYENNIRYQVVDGELFEIKPGESGEGSSIFIPESAAQELFNNLWNAGLRSEKPDEGTAKDQHIQDLRMIAFHAIGITK